MGGYTPTHNFTAQIREFLVNAVSSMVNVGLSPSLAISLTYVASGQSVGMLMENAVANKQHSQTIVGTCVDQCCTLMLGVGAAAAAKG